MSTRHHSQPTVALVGACDARTAYAEINREWSVRLRGCDRIVFASVNDVGSIEVPADCVVFHDFEQEFLSVIPPADVSSAAVRPWDFGPYPARWAERINDSWSQLWVHSDWLRCKAIEGGIEADRVRIVRLGFDASVFRPDGNAFDVATDKRFRFLFVGGPTLRKGMDVLLDAYDRAFAAHDDVALIIKSNPDEVFYRGVTLCEAIQERARRSGAPEILLIDEYLTSTELAALYRTADIGVFPYRAEGFCLPIVEAMACGTPSIVPSFGACLDYCSPANSIPMPVRRIALPTVGRFAFNALGFEEHVDAVDFCEPSPDVLAKHMREAFATPSSRRADMGKAAARDVHERYTWEHSILDVMSCVDEMTVGRRDQTKE